MNCDKPSISFGGGGLRSMTHCTGIITGFLENDITLIEFLDKFDIVSGNSGGSWFMSMMIYSPDFHEMLDKKMIEGKPPVVIPWWDRLSTVGWGEKQTHKLYPENSYDHYLKRMYNNEKTHVLVDNKIIKWLFHQEFMSPMFDFFGPFVYYIGMSLNTTIKELIFNSLQSESFDYKLSDACNAYIANHCVWGCSLILDCVLTDKLQVSINHPLQDSIQDENHGVAIPIFFDYNHEKSCTEMKLYEGLTRQVRDGMPYIDGSYIYSGEYSNVAPCDFARLFALSASGNESVSDIASISGAPLSALASPDILNNVKPQEKSKGFFSKFSIDYILSFFSFSKIDIWNAITTIFEEMAIPVALDVSYGPRVLGAIYDGGMDIGRDNGKHKIRKEESLIKDNVVRMGDGGYIDNTSIAYALKTFQKKNKPGAIFRHLNITSLTYNADISPQPTMPLEISELFGTYEEADVKLKDLKIPLSGSGMDVKQSIIFIDDDRIWNQSSSRWVLWWGCIGNVSVNINLIKTKTAHNSSFGIEAGMTVHLFVISVISDDDVFIFPGSDSADQKHYVDTAKKVNKLMVIAQKEFPALFDIMCTNPNDIGQENDLEILNKRKNKFPITPTEYKL